MKGPRGASAPPVHGFKKCLDHSCFYLGHNNHELKYQLVQSFINVICLFRFAAVALHFGNHKNIIWYEFFFFWSPGPGANNCKLALQFFYTLFFRHNSRHYVIFQLQINYLTGLPFVLSPSDPCNFERLSKIHSCMFFPYYNSSNNIHEKNSQF